MAVDVMKTPPFVETPLRWYSPKQTTPFALCGHLGPVLVLVPTSKFGATPFETVWFGDNGWETEEGDPFDEADILAFAIPRPPYAEVMEKIAAALGEPFECNGEFGAWLQKPRAGLDGQSPMQWLEAGRGDEVLAAVIAATDPRAPAVRESFGYVTYGG